MTIPVLWTNDDITFGQTEQLTRQLEMLDRHGVPGIFFVVPKFNGGTIDQDASLLRTIEKARARGHEFYQHGTVHDPFECGVPELWMLDFSEPVRRRYDEERLAIESRHTLDAQVEMLETGQRIWRKAFHESSPGFRPGWGAFCTNLYRALKILGYQWVSSRLPCPTSWLWNLGRWDAPLNFRDAVTTRPHKLEGMLEFPIAGDYAFRVPNEPARIQAMVDLGLREYDVYVQRGDPMLIVSHHHGLSHNNGSGYAVHERLIPAIRERGSQFTGMSDLAYRYQTTAAA